ncbi:GrpB family protein [Alkaliphilus transvaalensis]|uniref:GrpB family protein n=1 Tax=Alkaliphilus transvaalensis TaxID=114628 RepID=UPI00047A2BA8|nr:GrpB family protein [Alkaliphilus transvaalensis]
MNTKRKVEILPYNKEWPVLYRQEVDNLKTIIENLAIDFHHIGSTAIVGIQAKPIIDIMVEVSNIDAIDMLKDKFINLGYVMMGEYGIPNRRFIIKGDLLNRSHHIHIFLQGDKEVGRHLNFRDYLNAHPHVAQEYSNLKLKLVDEFPDNMEGYIAGKNALIKEIDKRAEVWVMTK